MCHLEGKLVEVYCGDIKHTHILQDFSRAEKSIIRGRVKDAMGDCIILQCEKDGRTNDIFINCWSISTISPINGQLSMKEMYYDEEEVKKKR